MYHIACIYDDVTFKGTGHVDLGVARKVTLKRSEKIIGYVALVTSVSNCGLMASFCEHGDDESQGNVFNRVTTS
jgi:hypothetical protein